MVYWNNILKIELKGGGMEGFIWLFILANVYFIPTWNAYSRKHKNREAILTTNLFLGWSGLGWVIALIWSCTNTKEESK